MIIQNIAGMWNNNDRCVHNTAKALDWAIALTLLVVGILGVCGVMGTTCALAYSFLGAGVVYTAVMLLSTSLDIKVQISTRNRLV